MKEIGSIQKAVKDVAMIRRAIERVSGQPGSPRARRSVLDANLVLQTLSLVFAASLALTELLSGHVITQNMRISRYFFEDTVLGLGQVGLVLGLLVMCVYFVVWRSARHGEQEFSEYVARNFRYLRSVSFLGDLLVKFLVLSLLVLAPRPEWIAPMLALFTGDYLIQGRFFNLPIKLSLFLGIGCVLVAAGLYLRGIDAVLWPLLLFVAVNLISLARLIHHRRQEPPAEDPEGAAA